MSDENFTAYTLNPPPQDNVTSLSPYTYLGTAGTDQDDSAITIGSAIQPPVAGNDAYSVTARSSANNASLNVGANAEQTLTFSGTPLSGSFALSFEDQSTAPLNYSSVASTLQSTIQTALAGLSTIGTGNVAVSAASGHTVTVTFQGGLGGEPMPAMTATSALSGNGNPQLTVANTTNGDAGVLDNSSSPVGDPLQAVLESSPTDGTLSFNANGSFTYTPNYNFVGTDSFTFVADDTTVAGSAGYSNTATATINVTARLSIPTNLTGVPGGTVVVPVNMDDANPAGSGGIVGVSLAIQYNPSVFSINSSEINFGTLTNNTNTVQTITFGGVVFGGTFSLSYGGSTTGPIIYSTSAATLQSNIQAALNGLATVSLGNSVVSAVSVTDVTVTFQGSLQGQDVATMTDSPNLQGTNPTMAIATTTTGFGAWGSSPGAVVGTGAELGQLAVTESSSNPNINSVGGSLVLLTFNIIANAPAGSTPIIIEGSNTSNGTGTVVTRVDGLMGQIPLSPVPINGNVPGVDGLVTIIGPHLNVSAPAAATQGSPITFTVTAENANGTTNTAYNGTVTFTSTDPAAHLPANSTLVNGVGAFTGTLNTVGSQTLTATDTVTSAGSGSTTIVVTSAGTAEIQGTVYDDLNGNGARDGVGNLIVNGDFSAGNTGFQSQYTYNATSVVNETVYTVGPNPADFSPYVASFGDHTSGSGLMMIVNGGSVPTQAVWEETVAVPANTEFAFSAFGASTYPTAAAILHVTINGQVIGSDLTLSSTTGLWSQYTGSWNSQTATTAVIAITDLQTAVSGNDFALDDISMTTVPPIEPGLAGWLVYLDQNRNGTLDPGEPSTTTDSQGDYTFAGLAAGSYQVAVQGQSGWQPTNPANDEQTVSLVSGQDLTGVNFGDMVAPTHFSITAPAAATAGTSANFTVSALAANNAVATNYDGTVEFTSSDSHANLPANATLTNGVGLFSVTLKTAGVQTLTATDTVTTTIAGTSNIITVSPGAATHFNISGTPSTLTAGSNATFTVTALDSFNNIAAGYTGTLHFTSSDSQAVLPGNNTLVNGVGSFSETLKTAGEQTVTATDTSNNAITGSGVTDVVASMIQPFVESINRASPAGPVTNASTVSYTVTFNEAVTGVAAADFQLALTGTAAGTVSQVTPVSAAVYTVSVSGVTGNGSVGLNLVDNGSIRDLAGKSLTQENAPAAFLPKQTFTTGSAPDAVALGDLNGDGELDVVVANRQSDSVSVLLGNGNGTFQTQNTVAVGGNPDAVALGDLNGDGKLDLIVANAYKYSGTVSVLLGNGNGTFQARQTFATADDPSSVALGDVNGDGKPDIVVANETSYTVSVLLGNGNGTFQAQKTYLTGSAPVSAALADVNGDGKPDLIVANENSNTVSVLLGNGNGTFQAQNTFATGVYPSAVALGDVNGDGHLDLAVVNRQSNTGSLLLGNGNGTFQAQQTFSAMDARYGVEMADVNGDGKTDLIVSNGNSTIGVLLGNGNGTFQAEQTFSGGHDSYALAIGDVNGDGRPDLVVPNSTSGTVSVLLGTSNGNFAGQVFEHTTGTATNLAIGGLPSIATAGTSLAFTLTALDSSNNVVPGYTGTVQFMTTDSSASSAVPSDYTFVPADGGIHVFTPGVILVSSGVQTITAFDTAINALSVSAAVSVMPAAATHFAIEAPTSVPPNAGFNFTVTALDSFGNTVTGYTGTVDFASSDSQALLPANATLANGVGTFGSTLKTGGKQTLTVTDSGNGAISGSTVVLAVTSSGVAPYVESINRSTPAGPNTNASTVSFTVTFSQPVDGVNPNDFQLVLTGTATGTLARVTPVSGAVYTVTVTGITGAGNVGLNLVDNGNIFSLGGNPLTNPNAPPAFAFNPPQTNAASGDPHALAIGDVNGDGKPDLVVGDSFSSTVSVLLGNGNGTFQPRQTFAAAYIAFSLALGDVNGDGKPDIVVANENSTVSVLLGNGNGTFQAQQTFATGFESVAVAIADVNGDGKPDLVVANLVSSTVSVLLGNGNGTFQAQQTFATGSYPISLAIADVNGDGKPDIIVANNHSNTVSVLLGNGNGTFQPQQTFAAAFGPAPGNGTISVAVGDVNGDGKPDIVVANDSANGTVGVLLGNGDGTFQALQTVAVGSAADSVAIADVNGDGKADLVVADAGTYSVSVLLGNGNGTFQAQELYATGNRPATVLVGDVSGDGKPDIVVANEFGGTVSVLLGNGNGTFLAQPLVATGNNSTAATVGDVNGDGVPDLIVADGEVSVLLGNGNGTFQSPQTFAAGSDPDSVALADLTRDGIADLIAANYESNTVSVLLGNGNGTFQTQQTFATGLKPDSVAIGDVNGDGIPDLVVANLYSSAVSVLLGNGNGTFQAQQTFAAGKYPSSVMLSDVNGDGKSDIIVANKWNNALRDGTVSVLLGNGNGTFQVPQTFATGAFPGSVAVGDFNGDGKPDLVVVNLRGEILSVLLGNGNGTFQTQQTLAVGVYPTSVTVADVNGDGKLDLLVTESGSDAVGVLLGNGNGTFQAQENFAAGDYPIAVAVGDENSDGRTDLVVADGHANTVAVLLNSANGNFTGQVYTITNPATHLAVVSPGNAVAGATLVFTVTALDQFNNTALGYGGTVHFTSSDSQANVQANATLTNGVGLFSVTLKTAGIQTLTATDTLITSIAGTSNTITVSPGAATHFNISGTPSTVAQAPTPPSRSLPWTRSTTSSPDTRAPFISPAPTARRSCRSMRR